MGRIGTNVAALVARHELGRANADLQLRLQRLSTGLRINGAGDDPSGVIASEAMRAELAGMDRAVTNTERAISVLTVAEGALAEVADLLQSIRGLVVEAASEATLTADERDAIQLEIDDTVAAIDRIATTTTFGDLALLDGSLAYVVSGVSTSVLADVDIHAAQLGHHEALPVRVEVMTSAQTGSLFLSGNTAGAAGELLSSVTLEIAGNDGVRTIDFVSGTNLSAVAAAVNLYSDTTGVAASLVDDADQTSGLVFTSTAYGADRFVSVRRIGDDGDFFTLHAAQGDATVIDRDAGRDVTVAVNGDVVDGRGLDVAYRSSALDVDLTLTETTGTTEGTTHDFTITGGGTSVHADDAAGFASRLPFAIASTRSENLGGLDLDGVWTTLDALRSGGELSVASGRGNDAGRVLDAAIGEIATLRGRLGALEGSTLRPNLDALESGMEQVAAGISLIRDADFAAETAALTRAQILMQAGTSVLAAANSRAQDVLTLLR